MIKAKLLYALKETLNNGLLVEWKVWKVPQSEKYSEGIKYRLALVDPQLRKVILLYDNHWPKGSHIHRKHEESSYRFQSLSILLEDFLNECLKEAENYRENQKNRHSIND